MKQWLYSHWHIAWTCEAHPRLGKPKRITSLVYLISHAPSFTPLANSPPFSWSSAARAVSQPPHLPASPQSPARCSSASASVLHAESTFYPPRWPPASCDLQPAPRHTESIPPARPGAFSPDRACLVRARMICHLYSTNASLFHQPQVTAFSLTVVVSRRVNRLAGNADKSKQNRNCSHLWVSSIHRRYANSIPCRTRRAVER